MTRTTLFFLLLTATGCFPYDGPPSDSASTEADADTDTDADTDSDQLTNDHLGWEDPGCWSCHAEDAHNSGLAPYECASCHGTNGAPGGHTNSTPCGGCHDGAHGGGADFPDPDSCLTCHPN